MASPVKTGKRAGYVNLTTRVPGGVINDLKHRLAPIFGGTLTTMYGVMLNVFLTDRPWEHGYAWRETKNLVTRREDTKSTFTTDGRPIEAAVTVTKATGWLQISLRLDPVLAGRVQSAAAINGVSVSAFLYTAIHYWIMDRNPTDAMRQAMEERRRKA